VKAVTRVDALVGNTPLVWIRSFDVGTNRVYAKLEMFNPGGSVKDRVALNMIERAEEDGLLESGMRIVEPTSGNTGIGLAMIGASRGYRVTIVMPESVTKERIAILKAYGAEVVLTPKTEGIRGAIERASAIKDKLSDVYIPMQFSNPANPQAHRMTTGPEIADALDGSVDVFVAGIGTGGTISGAGGYLKEKMRDIRVIGVEPSGSAVISGQKPGKHAIQGIGAGFIPDTLDRQILDRVMTIDDDDAYRFMEALGEREGIFVGPSSGAAMAAVLDAIHDESLENQTIVTVFPDGGERYLSLR
jgi:cysteine synthase A